MPRVTVHDGETPSEQLVKEALKDIVVTDKRGRVIKLAKPAVLAQFKLVKLLGDAAANETYRSMVYPLLFVTSIDNIAVFFPSSELEIDALITRLDEDGLQSVMEAVQKHFGAGEETDDAAKK